MVTLPDQLCSRLARIVQVSCFRIVVKACFMFERKSMSVLPLRSRHRLRRSICCLLAIAFLIVPFAGVQHISAQTPAASPETAGDVLPEGPLGEQIGWVIGAANGDVNVTDPSVISAHFSPEFVQEIGLPGLISFAYGLVRTYSPVTIDSVTPSADGASAVTMLTAADGTPLRFSLAIDPATGLITGLEIVPADRAPLEASPVASPAASPVASPVVAAEPPPTWAEIGDDYTAAVAKIQESGKQAVGAFMSGDFGALAGSFREDLQTSIDPAVFDAAYASLTTNRVHFEFAEVGAIFDGHVADGKMDGFFTQGALTTFSLAADDPQDGDVPTGLWEGVIGNGQLEFSVTFAGTAGALTATLDIPSQDIDDAPLRAVSFAAERPIGAFIDMRVQPLGGANNGYAEAHEWGAGIITLNVIVDESGVLTSFFGSPQWPLPADPATTSISANLPFDGAWVILWGGDTEFQNYHAVAPQQRHAYDIAIWKNGGTHSGDGTNLEDFYAYGQTVLAPVAGDVVETANAYPDIPTSYAQAADPSAAQEAADLSANVPPVGNHVVIETADGQFVYLAHMQPGSVQVAVGDTVAIGDAIGLVGNSGNTSEPHIHIHAQTALDLFDPAAIGVPIAFDDVVVNGEPATGIQPVIGDIVEPAK
jgi:murein DD-endopeptidase MepM/ murein hydrolase activator NlpD